ncbi:phospho-sugar mutase [Actinokineospora enzanensis]|uniref:phospho-sugar mutase n=1 Tax=Actinokineospora enzanensis TaxID=155975 RepID=UPI0003725DA9|nr:phospho-sugar mutase [Actinokineospora enzanensis]
MTRLTPDLRDRAFRWIADDPDPDTRAELQQLVAEAMGGVAGRVEELEDRMSGPLTFGTAGLRGPVRAGPNGMNRAVVIRTTAGLAAYLVSQGHSGGIVVVGRDARHGSEAFWSDTVAVLTSAGFDVHALAHPMPTPIVAYATRKLGAVAGVQITASHNPPQDNGYKVYVDAGAQIIPPADKAIEAAIAACPAAVSIPLAPDRKTIDDDVFGSYLDHVATLPRGTARALRVAATGLHGVGAGPLGLALHKAGFDDIRLVTEQSLPDPDFPTVSFPNPEEPGATDLLLALATETAADIAIALDPDADRCSVGVRDGSAWRMLTGDEVGALLGEYLLSTSDAVNPLVANTIVSSSLLQTIAVSHGARYASTLTGFKWLVRAGEGLVYAYEEALGHCVDPDVVRDKDGISAAVVLCDLAATLRAAGHTLMDALNDLALRHGLHATRQVSLRVTDLSRIGAIMAALRTNAPAELAGIPVSAEDLLPDANVLRYTGSGVRVLIRPSGTEPKVKAYLEVVIPVADAAALPAARTEANDRLTTLAGEIATLLES